LICQVRNAFETLSVSETLRVSKDLDDRIHEELPRKLFGGIARKSEFFGVIGESIKGKICYTTAVDSLEALAIALDHGGNEFLTQHDPDQMVLYLERQPTVPGARLKWRASFWDWSTDELLWVKIDPQTGEVIEVERQ
jgi:hypothetical protein